MGFIEKESSMHRFAWAIALAASLGASGCGHTVEARLLSVEIIRNPDTGEISRVSHWQFPNGDVVATQDRFKKDTPVTDRRGPGRTPTRVVLDD